MTTARSITTLSVLAASTLLLPGCDSDSPAGPFTCTPGTPVVATFTNLGTFQAATVSEQGTTVTGSSNVNVLSLNGLGIVGGMFDNDVDGTEWIRFAFDDSPVSEVSYHVIVAGNLDGDGTGGDAVIEAFDRMGTSLGTTPVTGAGLHSVSTMFGDEPLSAFIVTADVDNFRISRVEYSPCQ